MMRWTDARCGQGKQGCKPHEIRQTQSRRAMITPGRYSSWFKTRIRQGSGIVEIGPDGKLGGGDDTFVYNGRWSHDEERFRATLPAKRVVPGPPGVFGRDEVDIVVSGL